MEDTQDVLDILKEKVFRFNARVAELVDALDLGSSAARRESSSLSFRTKSNTQETLANFG